MPRSLNRGARSVVCYISRAAMRCRTPVELREAGHQTLRCLIKSIGEPLLQFLPQNRLSEARPSGTFFRVASGPWSISTKRASAPAWAVAVPDASLP